MKKAPEEIGEVDGEIVDANKIETALRTVGVALRDTEGQFRNLDEVFLELASKWDSLDTNTQRYIATISAGSRQQSRFIAMMSDYSRTQELVTAANTAAGASNEQFQKTLESLESKLAALKNAWDTFSMGIANSSLISGVIDILTGILNAVNKVTNAFGEWPGLAAKIGLVTAALWAGGKALKIFMSEMQKGTGVLGSFGKIFSTAGGNIKKFVIDLKTVPTATLSAVKATSKYSKAMSDLTVVKQAADTASKKLIQAENDLSGAKLSGRASNKKLIQLEEQRNIAASQAQTANAQLATSQVALNESLGLSAAEMGIYNSLLGIQNGQTGQNIGADTAYILTKSGVTTANVAAYATTHNLTMAEAAEEMASKRQGASGLKLILIRLSEAATNLLVKLGLGTLVGIKSADVATTGAQTTATEIQTGANVGLLITLWPILLATLLIVAAVGTLILLIYGIVRLFKALKANSPEGKFEAASEALKKATENATKAKDTYNELKDSLESINNKYDALDDLVVGTREWRDALLEVNGEVLDLIDKYPGLVKVINENGVLKISKETQEELINMQAKVVAQTQAVQYSAQIDKNTTQANLHFSKLSDKAVGGAQVTNNDPVVSGSEREKSRQNNRDITDQLAEALANGSTTNETMNEWLKANTKLSDSEINRWLVDLRTNGDEAANSLKEYGEQLIKHKKEQETAMQGMISSAVAMVDANKYTQEQMTQMANVGIQLMDDTLAKMKQKIEDQNSKHGWEKNQDYIDYWEGIYDEGKVKIGNYGKVQVKNDKGKWVDEVSAEQARLDYAASETVEELSKKLEKLPAALSKVADSLNKTDKNAEGAQKALNKAFNDDQGAGLSRADLEYLTKDYLKDIWDNNKELQEIYEDYTKFEEEMTDRTALEEQAFEQNEEKLANIGLEDFSFDKTLTAGAEKGLVEHLSQVVAVSGPATARALGSHINDILGSVAEEDRDKVVAQLNSIDWHNVADLESLPEVFKEIGVNIPHQDLVGLIDDLKNAAHAIRQVNFEKLNESLIGINKLIKDIYSNDQSRVVDSSVYETIISIDPKLANLFGQDLEGNFVFLGESMEDLGKIIVEKANDLVEIGTEQTQNKINTANVLDTLFGDGTKSFANGTAYNMANSGNWKNDEQKQFIQDVINKANSTGISLEGIDKNLSNNTNVAWLDEDKLKEIINSLKGIYGQQTALTNQMEKDSVAAYSKAYQSSNVYRNATSELAQKAQTSKLTETEKAQFQGQRNAILIQAVNAGISERDIKKVTELDKKMRELEADGKTGTDQYKEYAKTINYFSKQLARMIGYQNMRTQLQDIITLNNDLMESYKKTSDEEQKMFLTKQMLQDFDIKVTKQNYEQLAGLVNDYLQGNIDGFRSIINLAGQAAGIEAEAYSSMLNMTKDSIEAMGEEYIKFADDMIAKGYAMWDAAGKFIWGTATIKDLAKEIVEEIEKWENPYNWLYNMNSKINALMKKRELLEKEFQRSISNTNVSAEDMASNLTQQISLLEQATTAEKSRYNSAKQQMLAYVDEINNNPVLSNLQGAIAIGPSGQITVDKELLASIDVSNDEGSVVEEMISAIQESYDTMSDSLDQIEDNTDTIIELRKTGKDQYNSLLERIRDGLEKIRQDEIDKLSNINDSINDVQSALISKIQEQIDEQRQERTNQKTEEGITDKQTRLAYLQASGGNATEILKLQKEIANDQESYQDSLIDQTLNEMQKANDKAADQRQTQIDIAQAQLDYWSENGSWKEAESVLTESLAQVRSGIDTLNTPLGNILGKAENLDSKAYFQKEDWTQELEGNGKLAILFDSMNNPAFVKSIEENGTFGQLKAAVKAAWTSIAATEKETKEDFTTLKAGNTTLLDNADQFKVSLDEIEKTLQGWKEKLAKFGNDKGPSGPTEEIIPEAQALEATGIEDYEKQVGSESKVAYTGGGDINERFSKQDGRALKVEDRYSLDEGVYYDKANGSYINANDVDENGKFGSKTVHYANKESAKNAAKYSGDDYKSVIENGVQKFYLAADKYMEKVANVTEKVSAGLAKVVGDTLDIIDEKFSGDLKEAVKTAIDEGIKTTTDGTKRTGDEINTVLEKMSDIISGDASATFEELAEMGVTFSEETCEPITNYVKAEAEESKKKIEAAQKAVADAQKAYNEATTEELKADAKDKLEKAQANLKDVTEKQLGILTACGEVGQTIMTTSKENGGVAITSVAESARVGIQGILELVKSGNTSIDSALSTVMAAAQAALDKIKAAVSYDDSYDNLIGRDENGNATNRYATGAEAAYQYVATSKRVTRGENGEFITIYGILDVKSQGKPSFINEEFDTKEEAKSHAKKLNGYATGGLADFTGPAWLDGTKSAPELVLNATDTANFIELKDVLSEILRGSHERATDAEGAKGNNYYDIKVEVDSIDSDYGVDQAADRVRELIEEDAMYRNVTAVNKTR